MLRHMTKRELLKWLEWKRETTLQQVQSQYQDQYKILKEKAVPKMGLPDIADKIESHMDAVHKLWMEWKERNADTEGLSFKRYYNLEGTLSNLRASKGDTLKYIIDNEIKIVTLEMAQRESAYKQMREKIKANYANVIAAVESMGKAKDAAEYLVKLGFDLTELRSPKQKVTALTVRIDTSYLFIQTAA